MAPEHQRRPSRFWVQVARLIISGEQGPLIQQDLEDSFARDLDRGVTVRRASRRYVSNLLGSAWSIWSAGLVRLVARGTLLDAKLGVRMRALSPP